MPFKEPGTDELLARVRARTARSPTRRRRRAGRRDRAHARHADASRTSRSTWATSARCSTTCCRCCAPASCSCCARRSRPARPSSSPATWRSSAASRVGEDVFVAHVPERIAADRFLDEIGTLPCIVGGVGEASGERAARLFERLGAPIVQTTPVQAELAKIWTNILRYATFALPEPADDGLRALRRERLRRHRADQPRLPARRDGAARASPPAPACARTSRSPRSARTRPGMLLPSRA